MKAIGSIIAPLFVPANRPERFAKAAASGADAIILDLEDAVPADAKAAARTALREAAFDVPLIVRINGAGSPWHADDVAALAALPLAAIMLPKSERVEDIAPLCSIAPVIALVETARGLVESRSIARSGLVARLAFGSVDYAADLQCDHVPEALGMARMELVLASRLAGLPSPIDGVTTDLGSPGAAHGDARAARALGFGGKLVIHPSQVGAVLDAFRPTAAELDWARRVIESGDGAVRIDGAMVDEPVRIRAHMMLARAGVDIAGPQR